MIAFSFYNLDKWINDHGDTRITQYWLMSSMWPVLLILIAYLYFVLKLGPSIMKNRKPFNIDRIVMIYNIVQVLYSTYLVKEAFRLYWFQNDYRFNCIEMDYSYTDISKDRIFVVWLYFISKVLDLLDTIFFVLRKKQNQVTFLHVYHHGMVLTFGWIFVKFYPGGQLALFGTINAFVHAIMYSYYFLTVLKPEYKKAWWKKYLTQLQLIQFVITAVNGFMALLAKDCSYPKSFLCFVLPQDIFMFFLFWNFYKKTYLKIKNI
ncbi:elongation of very long chain fatty acids protein AAEL008004-like [Daktulosphaira vitifoliae]|uniref:elongation of very long chain fatty acids protein AAEL008004-like n=1 Tax=Daktulosphaira vitifoliae TaxID=58002 RepID=UPI0021AB0073|nr:elongation of very long chain fatty acids protein AAEL008004-like [Daktulosphaira vitifoliae]XP_050521967.1 elongation of very long chain fatty acids protein AAEL008004-like [Daktulosphaira vitifoliae]XP_050521968.1 elongation of very long chain fatty acids protein AAEL008004-like [Daktulosphaira vitifoliae]